MSSLEREDELSHQKEHSTNIVIMSDAGKPIFVRHGNLDDIVQLCAMVQTLRATVSSVQQERLIHRHPDDFEEDEEDEDLDSFTAGGMRVVCMHVGCLTLLAYSKQEELEVRLRLQVEYVYTNLLFLLTNQFQSTLAKNPKFDMTSIFSNTDEKVLCSLLDSIDFNTDKNSNDDENHMAGFLTCAAPVLLPLDPELRRLASMALRDSIRQAALHQQQHQQHQQHQQQQQQDLSGGALYGLLCVKGGQLLTVLQLPPHRGCALHTFDLRLLLHFVQHHLDLASTGTGTGVLSYESWIPLCLPRFEPKGFVYAYAHCLQPSTGLTLVLVSATNTTQQFELFRQAKRFLCHRLHLHLDDNQNASSTTLNEGNPPPPPPSKNFLEAIQHAMNPSVNRTLLRRYCSVAPALHFVLRRDVDLITGDPFHSTTASSNASSSRHGDGVSKRENSTSRRRSRRRDGRKSRPNGAGRGVVVSQCVASPLFSLEEVISSHNQTSRVDASSAATNQAVPSSTPIPVPPFPNGCHAERRTMWNMYHRLALRLRHGSASVTPPPTFSEEDKSDETHVSSSSSAALQNGSDGSCPTQDALSMLPSLSGVTYVVDVHHSSSPGTATNTRSNTTTSVHSNHNQTSLPVHPTSSPTSSSNPLVYVGLNGQGFECYATLSSKHFAGPRDATGACARLVRALLCDRNKLFLNQPITWWDGQEEELFADS